MRLDLLVDKTELLLTCPRPFTTPKPCQVKDVMIENIAKVLDRGEKLDLLVDKTELLQGEAFAFRREAARARRVMWWKVRRAWCVACLLLQTLSAC